MHVRIPLLAALFLSFATPSAFAVEDGYAIVVSNATADDAGWGKVVAALEEKHGGFVVRYDELSDALPTLSKRHPRYTCFLATRDEATRQFVADVHRLTRRYDADPYTDTLWAVLTGYDAANALGIARTTKPLVVEHVTAGTEVALQQCKAGVWFCELNPGKVVRKTDGGEATTEKGPVDSTRAIAEALDDADLFVTSGHATERNWQIGFRYRNGYFVSQAGQLYGLDTERKRFEIHSPNPKVFMAVGNCLAGHVDGPDAMALAHMKSNGVRQMVGYTVLTWYGYAGWGCLDYFVEQPGRYTLVEGFHANGHALVHRLVTEFPDLADQNPEPGRTIGRGDGAGLLHDRDVVALYGDPAWSATMADGSLAWEQTLTERDGTYTFTVTPKLGEQTFDPVNTNGSQRGGRPIVAYLPHRIANVKVTAGGDLNPVVTDDFVLVPNPGKHTPGRTYRLEFTADRVESQR